MAEDDDESDECPNQAGFLKQDYKDLPSLIKGNLLTVPFQRELKKLKVNERKKVSGKKSEYVKLFSIVKNVEKYKTEVEPYGMFFINC